MSGVRKKNMKIIIDYPPIWDEACKAFDLKGAHPMFAWGDIIYNPFDTPVPPEHIAHEEVHKRQQKAIGGPEKWWHLYLTNREFRLTQELAAYSAQYKSYCKWHKDKNQRFEYLKYIGTDLASPMYKIGGSAMEYMEIVKKYYGRN